MMVEQLCNDNVKRSMPMWMSFILTLGLLILSGCGSGGSSLVTAKGKVLVDGAPAGGAILMFHPESSSNKTVSTAITEADGTFTPITDVDPGIPEGSYRVTVTWPEQKAASEGPKFGVSESADPPDLLKGKYSSRDKSKLTVTISRTKTELEPLELTKK